MAMRRMTTGHYWIMWPGQEAAPHPRRRHWQPKLWNGLTQLAQLRQRQDQNPHGLTGHQREPFTARWTASLKIPSSVQQMNFHHHKKLEAWHGLEHLSLTLDQDSICEDSIPTCFCRIWLIKLQDKSWLVGRLQPFKPVKLERKKLFLCLLSLWLLRENSRDHNW